MRHLQFRAWIKQDHKMIYGVGIFNGSIFTQNEEVDTPEGRIYDEDLEAIPMQAIDLADKNGRNYYEGDVVRLNDGKTYVIKSLDSYIFSEDNLFSILLNSEIIGNVYEYQEQVYG